MEDKLEKAFLTQLEPRVDFLPGSLLVDDAKALSAARKKAEEEVQSKVKGSHVNWIGTIGVIKIDNKVIDRIEIHGATYNRITGEITGLRISPISPS